MAGVVDFDSPSGWRDPHNLVKRGELKRRYMSDLRGHHPEGADGRAPLGSLRQVFKNDEDVVLTFLFRTELEQSRGNLGKALFRRKPPQAVRIVPTAHDVVNVTFEAVDGAKEYAVEIKPSGERDELFEIAWQMKTKKNITWGTVQRGTVKSLVKDPCQKINAIVIDVKAPVWETEDKEEARARWVERWDAWQAHWDDAREVICQDPPCQVTDLVGDSTYIARIKVGARQTPSLAIDRFLGRARARSACGGCHPPARAGFVSVCKRLHTHTHTQQQQQQHATHTTAAHALTLSTHRESHHPPTHPLTLARTHLVHGLLQPPLCPGRGVAPSLRGGLPLSQRSAERQTLLARFGRGLLQAPMW